MPYDKSRNNYDDPVLMRGVPGLPMPAAAPGPQQQTATPSGLFVPSGEAMIVMSRPGSYPIGGQGVFVSTVPGATSSIGNAPITNVLQWSSTDGSSRAGYVTLAVNGQGTSATRFQNNQGVYCLITMGTARGSVQFWALAPAIVPVQGTYLRVDAMVAQLPFRLSSAFNYGNNLPGPIPTNNTSTSNTTAITYQIWANWFDKDSERYPQPAQLGPPVVAAAPSQWGSPVISTSLTLSNTSATGIWMGIADRSINVGVTNAIFKGLVYVPGASTISVGEALLGSFGANVSLAGSLNPTAAGAFTEDTNDQNVIANLYGVQLAPGAVVIALGGKRLGSTDNPIDLGGPELGETGVSEPATQPVITSVSVNYGPVAGGTVVNVIGMNFMAGLTSNLGAVSALTSTSCTITTHAHAAGAFTWTVENLGTFPSAPQTFYYLAVPTITSISIDFASANGGESRTLTGTGLLPAAGPTTCTVDANAATITAQTATSITFTVPASSISATDGNGSVSTVSVTTGGGTGSTSGSPLNSLWYWPAYFGVAKAGIWSAQDLTHNSTPQVTSIVDLTGNGNTMNPETIGRGPLYSATGGGSGGTLPYMNFLTGLTGQTYATMVAAYTATTHGIGEYWIAGRAPATFITEQFLAVTGNNGDNDLLYTPPASADLYQYNGIGVTGENAVLLTASTDFYLDSFFANATTSFQTLNGGAPVTGTNPGANTANTAQISMGGNLNSATVYWKGWIYVFAWWPAALSSTARTNLAAYGAAEGY